MLAMEIISNFINGLESFGYILSYFYVRPEVTKEILAWVLMILVPLFIAYFATNKYSYDSDFEYLYIKDRKLLKLYFGKINIVLLSVFIGITISLLGMILGETKIDEIKFLGMIDSLVFLFWISIFLLENFIYNYQIFKRIGISDK